MRDASRSEVVMENSGHGPLRVPGFGGIPLSYELGIEDRFASAMSGWKQNPCLTVREIAMLQHMNDLTDRKDWHIEIFNNKTVAKWREETIEIEENLPMQDVVGKRLISAKVWDWCLMELREKALLFRESQFVRILDAGSSVCKSDTLVSELLRVGLRDGIVPLTEQKKTNKDWYPGLKNFVMKIVDDSLFPMTYGKTPVLIDWGQVGLHDCLESYGSGKVNSKHPDIRKNVIDVERRIYEERSNIFLAHDRVEIECFRWSYNFQLLPCEVKFNGGSGTDVQITSYINNLHPILNKSLYSSIGKLMSLAIKPWNDCLIKGEKGRWPIRIRSWGLIWEPEYPKALEEGLLNGINTDAFKEAIKEAEKYLTLPDFGSNQPTELPEDWNMLMEEHNWDNMSHDTKVYVLEKWEALRQLHHPEPGISFSYDDWRAGRNGRAIREKSNYWDPERPVQADPDQEIYSIKLEDMFRDKGLQVLVKIASIELTPDKPSYNDKDWHMDGLLNEHVVARAIYFYDVENVTETQLSFRQTANFCDDYHYDLEQGTAPGDEAEPDSSYISSMIGIRADQRPFQELGSVYVPQGRLVTWPTTLHHRLEPFTLVDPTVPGHRRFIMLSLVDPHYRVCSTQNVPPQRHDWWAEVAQTAFASRGIPQELGELITDEAGDWPVGMNEAKQNRELWVKECQLAQAAFLQRIEGIRFYDEP